MISAERFYAGNSGPPKQGDILLASVGRFVAEDRFSPPAWESLDAFDVSIELPDAEGELRLAVGKALVMVTSHDCHFDKEWNQRVRELVRAGVTQEEAEREAEADDSLDRAYTASPLVRVDDVPRGASSLRAGTVIGYLPVPASPDALIPEAVVDLTYRVTLDRLDLHRVACVSAEVRAQLRYALARLESLRTASVGFDIENVLGHQIEEVTFPHRDPLLVRLRLDDGTILELLQQPTETPPGPARAEPARR
jgi:hypothetical protein